MHLYVYTFKTSKNEYVTASCCMLGGLYQEQAGVVAGGCLIAFGCLFVTRWVVRKEATFTCCNIISGGSRDARAACVRLGVVSALCSLLDCKDVMLLMLVSVLYYIYCAVRYCGLEAVPSLCYCTLLYVRLRKQHGI